MHEQTHTPNYKTMNWPAYNEALKRRASLTTWFDQEMRSDGVPTDRLADGRPTAMPPFKPACR